MRSLVDTRVVGKAELDDWVEEAEWAQQLE